MRRREFIAGLGSAAWPLVARAQQPSIGVLMGRGEDDPEIGSEHKAFEQTLARFGWVVGRNIEVEYRTAGGDDARVRAFAQELVGKLPSVIVVYGTQASVVLKGQTGSIPIVFLNVADPVGSGLAASIPHPGGNFTGFTLLEFSLGGKWLSVLKEIAPHLTRVMFLYNPDNSNWMGYQHAIKEAAAALPVEVTAAAVSTVAGIASSLASFGREPGGGVIVVPSGFLTANREQVTALVIQHRLPTVYPYKYYAKSGGLISYGSDTVDLYRRAASYVDRILKGEKPGELPFQAPTKFELVINLKTAKALGLTIPETLLATADEVIQ
jgi:putative ABC transport system substrate-binding protein